MQRMMLRSGGSNGRMTMDIEENAISTFQAREEEIQKKKMEVKEKVGHHLGRAEEETRRLSQIWEELEVMVDPSRKEVANLRKKIDVANKELKALGQSCQKKEKEHRDLIEIFDEKTREKSQLIDELMERAQFEKNSRIHETKDELGASDLGILSVKQLLRESERSRLKKLEEMSKILESLH